MVGAGATETADREGTRNKREETSREVEPEAMRSMRNGRGEDHAVTGGQ
jgi:hypothetical protein